MWCGTPVLSVTVCCIIYMCSVSGVSDGSGVTSDGNRVMEVTCVM
jgi:hypothetical protein